MFDTIAKIISLKDLRNRILFTIGLIALYRLLAQIPLANIDHNQLKQLFSGNQLLGLLDIFSGGAISNVSIGLMGIGPYITSSIIIQLLTYVIPALELLQKEGEQGRQIIGQYTRLLTIPLGFIQSFALLTLLQRQGVITSLTPINLVTAIVVTTATTILIMWLGELISEKGIGNGSSLIITGGIVAGIPIQVRNTYAIIAGGGIIDSTKLFGIIAFIVISILTISFIVLVNDSIRKIPISYARRIIGRRSLGSADTYLPLKLNSAGVIPIIFALSIIVFPGLMARYIQGAESQKLAHFASLVVKFFDPSRISYGVIYFFLVVIFTYFYTSIVFRPTDVAENLQKQGGFIPGIRPGNETINYLSKIVSKITLPGSVFLGIVAVLPFIIQSVTKVSTLVLGGTSILIIVSVIMDTSASIKAHIITRSYDDYGVK